MHTESHPVHSATSALQAQLRVKDEQISELHKQLHVKDEQILFLQQNATTAQALHAGTIQRQLLPDSLADSEIAEESLSKWRNFLGWLKKR